jgi:hypothetical protein
MTTTTHRVTVQHDPVYPRQYRWMCSCGQFGPWTEGLTRAATREVVGQAGRSHARQALIAAEDAAGVTA